MIRQQSRIFQFYLFTTRAKTTLVWFIIFFVFVPSVKAAIIKSIKPEKRLVLLSEGKSTGFEEDKKVCFFSTDGEELGCGSIDRANNLQALVRVKDSLMQNLTPGLEATLSKDVATSKPDSSEVDSKKQPLSKSSSAKFLKSFTAFYDVAIRAGVGAYPATPYKFNYLEYVDPATSPDAASIWSPIQGSSSSYNPMNLKVELEYKPWRLCLGGKMISTAQSQGSFDYVTSSLPGGSSLDLSLSASNFGGYADFYGLEWGPFGVGLGAEVLRSTVTFSANLIDLSEVNDPELLYGLQSSLMLASLRIPARVNLGFLRTMGATLGASLVLPVVAYGTPAISISENITETENPSEDPEADLVEQLGHSKSSFSIEISLNAFFGFNL